MSGPLQLVVATSLSDGTPKVIDFSKTVGYNKSRPKVDNRDDSTCYFLPQKYNKNDQSFREDNIHGIFARMCHDAGFTVHAQYKKNMKAIVFSCIKGRFHNEEQNKKDNAKKSRDNVRNPTLPPKSRKKKTKKLVKDEEEDVDPANTCKVRFTVYWCEKLERWFVPHQQGGTLQHCGHMHINPLHLGIRSKFLPKDELVLVKDARTAKISATATGSLVKDRTGYRLNWQQVHHLMRKDKNDLFLSTAGTKTSNRSSIHVTAADRLLADLRNDPDISFVCLFADISSGLITIKQRNKRANNSSSIEEEEAFTADLGDDTCSPLDQARDMVGRENAHARHAIPCLVPLL